MVAKSIAKIYTNIHKPTDYRMLPREAENGVGMNRSARGGKCKAL